MWNNNEAICCGGWVFLIRVTSARFLAGSYTSTITDGERDGNGAWWSRLENLFGVHAPESYNQDTGHTAYNYET